jgi:hypothetical protein
MPFTYEKIRYLGEDCIEITGFEGSVRSLTIPDRIEGLAVRSIGKHAFAGRKDLREVVLPPSVKRLYLFAFHNCAALRRMSLYDSVEDYYDGVIRQCTDLEEIEIPRIRGSDPLSSSPQIRPDIVAPVPYGVTIRSKANPADRSKSRISL